MPHSYSGQVPWAGPRAPTKPLRPKKCSSADPCPRRSSPHPGQGHKPNGSCPATPRHTFVSNTPYTTWELAEWYRQTSTESGRLDQTAPRGTCGTESASSACSCRSTRLQMAPQRRSPQMAQDTQPNHPAPPTATAPRPCRTHAQVSALFRGRLETGASTGEIVRQAHAWPAPGLAVSPLQPGPPPPQAARPNPRHTQYPRAKSPRAALPPAACRGSPSAAPPPGPGARRLRGSSDTAQERSPPGRSALGATRSPLWAADTRATTPGAASAAASPLGATGGRTRVQRPRAGCGFRGRILRMGEIGAH
mmetsp:Transcript_95180/g.217958  ORF Transcript_95180/g.217958 Transcript_95180/m.217958 type:complete len:307 (+) Transcript_95180:147-1067(+)